jgi:uncharacterized protein YuzE
MNKTQLRYFEQEDVLHLLVAEGEETRSIELAPNITAEMNEAGDLIGIEILQASTFLRDFVLDTAQAKLLNLKAAA